jgi:hypothetical protein
LREQIAKARLAKIDKARQRMQTMQTIDDLVCFLLLE